VGVNRRASGFLQIGRFAEFAASAGCELVFEKATELGAFAVAEPHPNEMEDFVDEDEAQQAAPSQQSRLDHDMTPANEAGGAHGSSTGG
jgi:hypothetical protein